MQPLPNQPPDTKVKSGLARFWALMFDDGGIEEMFRHVRNIITASVITAAGIYATEHENSMRIWGVLDVLSAGYFVTVVGTVLFVLNLIDGLRRLAKFKQHFILQALLVILYLLITVRVAQLVLSFRST
jgi:ABC-type Co2+ transport system permease subunit